MTGASSSPEQTVLRFEARPNRALTLLLFRDVSNAQELRKQVLAGAIEPQVAFINAELVADVFPLHLAAHKALAAEARGQLTTKTLHTELLYNMSGSKNIGESLKRFGIADDSKHLLAARFDATADDVVYMRSLVKGTEVPMTELSRLCQLEVISKAYKVAQEELRLGSIADAVACRIASRDCNS